MILNLVLLVKPDEFNLKPGLSQLSTDVVAARGHSVALDANICNARPLCLSSFHFKDKQTCFRQTSPLMNDLHKDGSDKKNESRRRAQINASTSRQPK